MSEQKPKPLDHVWKSRLDLAGRGIPELYESADSVGNTPHAGAIRAALQDLGASAVFCVQGVPTIVILSVTRYDRDAVVDLHATLWNQGLASLLLVISDDTVRAFSLSRTPYVGLQDEFDRRCLVQTLSATADALALRNLVYAAESGRLWLEYSDFFKSKERVDQVLLGNLTESHRLLCVAGLSSDAAQALLIQTMFIAYLEDREIITSSYFLDASKDSLDNFTSVLEKANARVLNGLFKKLRADFNGDLFVAPCSFEPNAKHPEVTGTHLQILARFHSGREEMNPGSSQLRFWGYNFKYIPIELISAVYDRFLGEREAERRDQGAYYTPMFLADTVVSQVWDSLSSAAKDKGRFLDPACGSGVFLVRSFQRLCENWRETHKSQTIRWHSLLDILSRMNGWDLNGSSVRVAVFSLYIALLEEVSPPDIRQLAERGRLLPELWGKNLRCQDFFKVDSDEPANKFDIIIGNPPWASRRNPNRWSVRWSAQQGLPMPGKEDAWAFTWKALRHLSDIGIAAFLLPAMGFLHNHAENSVSARNRLIKEARIWRIINFADLRFQLFDGAVRPAALLIFGRATEGVSSYRFDYWAPKADLNLKLRRLITLSSSDRSAIASTAAIADPLVFKRRLWMSEPDAKLFNYLSAFSRLGDFIETYGAQRRRNALRANEWLIGQGFQPYNSDRKTTKYFLSEFVKELPYLSVEQLRLPVQSKQGLLAWPSSRVRRKGFERGFTGSRILIPRGVNTAQMRLRAAYTETPLTFQHIIQAISVPTGEERKAKLLTALLNSRVAVWFAFHGTASFGSDRPEVQQAELMRLPFPSPKDTPNPDQSERAASALVEIIDDALAALDQPFHLQGNDNAVLLDQIDKLSYQYFCLSEDEITLIEDAVEKVLPAVQPNPGSIPEIWNPAKHSDREAYAKTLVRSLRDWFKDRSVQAVLEARNDDLAVLRLTLTDKEQGEVYIEENGLSVGEALGRLFANIHQRLSGNFQLMPDFRIFFENRLYLIKPAQKRFWLRSTALADADAIALDLQDALSMDRRRGNA